MKDQLQDINITPVPMLQEEIKKLFETAHMRVIADMNGKPAKLHLACRELLLNAKERAREAVGEVDIEDVPIGESSETSEPSAATLPQANGGIAEPPGSAPAPSVAA